MKQVKNFPDWTSIHFCDTPRVILKKDLQQMSPEQVDSLGECYVLDTRKEGKMLQLLI